MSSPSNDPAQLLANLFESGQAMMRQFAATNAPDTAGISDPMTALAAASQQMIGLQQDYAMSPSNFLATNPEAMQATASTDVSNRPRDAT